MTKEEILSKVTYEPIGEIIKHDEVTIVRPSECYEAMDLFAKQECIEFQDWVLNYPHCRYSEINKVFVDTNNRKVITTEQLYELYILSKNN